MIIPLFVLGLGAIFYGFLTRDLVIGLGSLYFNSVSINFYNFNLIDSEFLNSVIKNIPFIFTLLGAYLSLLLINCFNINKDFVYNQKLKARSFYTFLNKK
jgi:NADH-ubiquinone oxidoreductase chain 5